jgi:hypothetical protein
MLDPPMGAIYLRAVFLAQRSGLAEVGVDEFLAALDLPEIDSFLNMDDFDPRVDTPPIRPGRFPLSDELQKALTAAGWRTLGETITRGMLRDALVAARKSRR